MHKHTCVFFVFPFMPTICQPGSYCLVTCLYLFSLNLHVDEVTNHTEMRSVQFSSVAQSCPTLCDPMNCSTPGLPVHHQLPEFTQTHSHRVGDAIQPSHPLSSPGGESLLDFLELRQVLSTYDGDLRDPLLWPQDSTIILKANKTSMFIKDHLSSHEVYGL